MADGAQSGPGLVLIRDGKIEAVRTGPHQQPPDGYTVLKATFVTPGLIDADTTACISGAYNVRADQDQDEAPIPTLRTCAASTASILTNGSCKC